MGKQGFFSSAHSGKNTLFVVIFVWKFYDKFVVNNKCSMVRLKRIGQNKQIDFYATDVSHDLSLPFVDEGIAAGFPSPAQDYMDVALDLNKELIKHPSATFYGRVKGTSMKDAGIEDGDILVIDRSLEYRNGMTAVCFLDGEFTVKKLKIDNNKVFLMPANNEFEPIEITEDNEFVVWGIVTYVIKKLY